MNDKAPSHRRAPGEVSDPPLVSVIVPTCNRRMILTPCVESLAGQTYPNIEIIIVDDGSTDDTPEYMQSFLAQHPDVNMHYLRHEEHRGANSSRNRGIKAAQGELIAFSDSDCIARPDWIEKLVAGFTSERVASVTGLVNSPRSRNIYDLAYKGTQRVPGPGPVTRLVGCNMCVRRDVLTKFMWDEDRATDAKHADGTIDVTVSGRGDEEGLFLAIQAAGYEQLAVPDAVVLHEHYYTRRSFFKQAFRGGRSAARLVYKYRLGPRLDMLPFMLAYVSCPLMFWELWLGWVSVFFFVGAGAAVTYNELHNKGKTIGELLKVFAVLMAYYHVRLVGYVGEAWRLRIVRHDMKRV